MLRYHEWQSFYCNIFDYDMKNLWHPSSNVFSLTKYLSIHSHQEYTSFSQESIYIKCFSRIDSHHMILKSVYKIWFSKVDRLHYMVFKRTDYIVWFSRVDRLHHMAFRIQLTYNGFKESIYMKWL